MAGLTAVACGLLAMALIRPDRTPAAPASPAVPSVPAMTAIPTAKVD